MPDPAAAAVRTRAHRLSGEHAAVTACSQPRATNHRAQGVKAVASDGRREKNAEERVLFRAPRKKLANSEPQIGLGIRPSETVRHCSVHRNASDDETGMTVLMPGTSSTATAWTARYACGSTPRRARVQSRGSRSKARFTAAPAAITPRAYSSDDEGAEYRLLEVGQGASQLLDDPRVHTGCQRRGLSREPAGRART